MTVLDAILEAYGEPSYRWSGRPWSSIKPRVHIGFEYLEEGFHQLPLIVSCEQDGDVYDYDDECWREGSGWGNIGPDIANRSSSEFVGFFGKKFDKVATR